MRSSQSSRSMRMPLPEAIAEGFYQVGEARDKLIHGVDLRAGRILVSLDNPRISDSHAMVLPSFCYPSILGSLNGCHRQREKDISGYPEYKGRKKAIAGKNFL